MTSFAESSRSFTKRSVTPLDPEDIHSLADGLESVIDLIEATAYRLDAYHLLPASPRMGTLAGKVDACVQALKAAVESLEKNGVKEPKDLSRLCEEVVRLESESQNEARAAVRDLFDSERDPIALIKTKEVYEYFESAADACERASDVLENIAVKNT